MYFKIKIDLNQIINEKKTTTTIISITIPIALTVYHKWITGLAFFN